MNLTIKNDKVPFEFVLKTVTVGITFGFGFLFLLVIVFSAFASLFIGVTEFIDSLNISTLLLPVFLLAHGFMYALVTALGIAVYSKFKKISVKME